MKKYIDIEIYHQRIYLTDFNDVKKYCSDNDLSCIEAMTYIGYRKRICLYLLHYSDDLLVHESVHLANFIVDRCAIYYTPQYDESMAYLVQYIYKKLKDLISKQRKKANEKTNSRKE